MVSQNQKKDTTEYDLDQLVQSSFNYGDEQLLEQIRKAEEMIGDDQIPPEPEDGYEQLLAKMAERGITAYSESDVDMESRRSAAKEEPEKTRKIRGLHTIIRVAIAAAIIGSVFTLTSVTAGAKKSYTYEAKSPNGERNKVVINNEENKEEIGSMKAAYEEVHKQLGIRVLQVRSKPSNMKYIKTVFDDSKAIMYFDIDGKMLILVQQIKTTENSTAIVSDCVVENTVYNEWLGKNIIIDKVVVGNKEKEFSATIVDDNGCYYLISNLDVGVFEKIVEDLNYIK